MDTKGSLEVMPSYIIDALKAHDIDASDIKISVKSDMTLDNIYMDSWVFITGDRLVLMDGFVHKSGKKKGKKTADIIETWEEKKYKEYPIAEFKDFKVEILPATNVVTANRNGDDFVVCKFTNTLGKKMRAFTELANKISEGKEITEEDLAGQDIGNAVCPKCGRAYRNQEEKICIHCIDRKKVFFRLLKYGSKYKWYMVAIIIFILISSGLALLHPLLGNKIFYDEVLSESGKYYGKVVILVGIILALRLVSLFVTILYGRINAVLSNHIVFNLRTDVFKSMQDLSISFFMHKQTGSLMTRVNRDSEHVQWFFLDGLPYLIVNFINIIGVSLLMISIRPALSLLVLIPAPFIFIFFRRWLPKFYKLFGRSHKRSSAMNARMNDSFMGLKVVKAFGKEDKENEDFSRASSRFSEANMHIGITSSTVFPIVSFVMWLGSLTIYIFGGLLIIEGKLLFGDIATLVGYVGMIYGPMQWFARLVRFWSRAMNSANRIFEVVDAEPEVKEKKDPVRKKEFKGDVKIENVSFSYEPNRMVLKNVNVDVKAGEHIGVVGHSGAGESTLVNRIARLYDADFGGIYIDGINI
ncbi:MAG: ATP-binding cassette domain-containing protein, partial [Clostridiaceae bacterium]|nr:ATP-binding cassette domain-containing protein [Clostridiaceae bacterium]